MPKLRHTLMKTFECHFGKGTTCTVQVADDPPAEGTTHIQKIEWSGTPTAKLLRPYIAWANTINQQLANQWGVRLTHIFLVAPGKAEVWGYEPGGKPQLLTVK